MNDNTLNSILKTTPIIESFIDQYGTDKIMCSISGGSDSDILLDICSKVSKNIRYVFFDTGIEYKATKQHIEYLQDRYNIEIKTEKSKINVVKAVYNMGYNPFLSKKISNEIYRLQKHNFVFTDSKYNDDINKYDHCLQALKWYHNIFNGKQYNIEYKKLLKEFLIKYPPQFVISDKCCDYCKKSIFKQYIKKYDIKLSIVGIRKYEKGVRSVIDNCFYLDQNNVYKFYPLLWMTKEDKIEYNTIYNIKNSECYTKYGLLRTGCAGCPFGNYKEELNIIKTYEPNLYNAVYNIFEQSYNYSDLYYKFRSNY